jgi:pimeloyl-ACP methyl ester carboxylesterase
MTDGVPIAYRLDGSSDPSAPLIVLSNSILVDWGIWDDFISAFLAVPQNQKFRFLRYQTRGRANNGGDRPATIDRLTEDLISLLDAIQVRKAAVLIGVSLGGITVLNAALKFPERVGTFVSCDTSAVSAPGNPKAWDERVAMAEQDEEAPRDQDCARLCGEKLAEATVRRWFVPESFDLPLVQARIQIAKEMVYKNNLDGFTTSAQALYSYDVRAELKTGKVPGMFLVGAGDSPLLSPMKQMAESYSNGAELCIIDQSGHLPMIEKPEEVAQAVTRFLDSNLSS